MAKVILCGLGAIGGDTLKHLLSRGHELTGVVDSDKSKIGKTARECSGAECDLRVRGSLQEVPVDQADVVVFTTSSRMEQIAPDLEYVLSHGVDVVSSSEELAYPAYAGLDHSMKIDAIAREYGATAVGVGVNPGFVMDWVPAVIASASKSPVSIRIVRSVDLNRRRKQLQWKTGLGMTRARFEKEVAEQTLGHVGLVESASLIALSLGKNLQSIQKGVSPILGPEDRVVGIRQFVEGVAGTCSLRLDLEMSVTAADYDLIEVKGEPNLKVRFEGGVFGDSATVALLVNAAERVGRARPGLITVLELPLVRS